MLCHPAARLWVPLSCLEAWVGPTPHSPSVARPERSWGGGSAGAVGQQSEGSPVTHGPTQSPALALSKWQLRPSSCSGLNLEATGFFSFRTSSRWSGNPISSTFKTHPESNQVPPLLPHLDSKHPPLVSLPCLHPSLSVLHRQPKGSLRSNHPRFPGKSTRPSPTKGHRSPLIWPCCLSDLTQLCHPVSLAHLAAAAPAPCWSSNAPGGIQPQGLCTCSWCCLECSSPSSFNSWISHFIPILSQGHCLGDPFPGYPAKVSPLPSPPAPYFPACQHIIPLFIYLSNVPFLGTPPFSGRALLFTLVTVLPRQVAWALHTVGASQRLAEPVNGGQRGQRGRNRASANLTSPRLSSPRLEDGAHPAFVLLQTAGGASPATLLSGPLTTHLPPRPLPAPCQHVRGEPDSFCVFPYLLPASLFPHPQL